MIKRYLTPLRHKFGLIHTGVSDLEAFETRDPLKPKFNEKLSVKQESHFLFLIKRLLPAAGAHPLDVC